MIIILFVFYMFGATQEVEFGFGFEIIPSTEVKRIEREPIKDGFMEKIAKRFEMNLEELNKLRDNGYGRFELIRMILISTESGKNFEEIVNMRKKMKLKNIAKELKINYKFIYFLARRIKQELER